MKYSFQVLSFLLGLCLVSTSCQRSPEFRKEEEFGKSDPFPRGGVGADKVEALGQPKKRVMILNFWNDTPVQQSNLGSYAADELRRGLFLSQRVILPTDVKNDSSTEDFIQGDQVKVAQLIREGRKMGVAVLVLGRVNKIVFRQRGDEIGIFRQKQSLVAVDLEAKLFDVQGGREIMSTSRSGEASSNTVTAVEDNNIESPGYRAELTKYAVREAIAGFVPDILHAVEKLMWQGRIAKILGTKVYLNAGRVSGLITGDILRVSTAGDEVYDPVTGAFLGRTPGLLKGTLEVVDFIGPDGAVSEVHTGGNFHEGDTVQLY